MTIDNNNQVTPKALKWAVCGSTGIAQRRTIPEGIIPANRNELVSLYSLDSEANAKLAATLGVDAASSLDQLLASDIDVVYIATPVNVHHEQVLACAQAGKHVLCEKPLALNVVEAQEMVTASRQAGVQLGVALMMRFHGCHQEAQRLIRNGQIGRPVFGRAQLSCWYPPIKGAWRQDPAIGGGGALMDLGAHCLDLLEMFLGRTRSVFCRTANLVHDYKSEDMAIVSLEFEDGAQGVVDCLFNVPDSSSLNRLELYGTAGSILMEGTIGQSADGVLRVTQQSTAADYQADQQRNSTPMQTLTPALVNPYQAQIEAFSQAVLSGLPLPISGEDGLHNQRVLAACYTSAKTAKAVAIE